MVRLQRVVEDGADRRAGGFPHLEVGHAGEGRDVVAAGLVGDRLGALALGDELEELLRRGLVAAERPDAGGEGQVGQEAAFRAGWHRNGPALLGHVDRVALGHGPGAGRVEHQRRLAGDERPVVGRIVPGPDVVRQEAAEADAELDGGLQLGVAADGRLARGIRDLRAIAGEEGTNPVHRIRELAHRQAEGHAGLLALLGGDGEGLPGPGIRARATGVVGRPHGTHVDAGMFQHQVEADAGRLVLGAAGGRYAAPLAAMLAEELGDRVDRAILADQTGDDLVNRLQLVGIGADIPGRKGDAVMAAAALRLGGGGQLQLVAGGVDEVERDVDMLLVAELGGQLLQRVVAAGHPMVPEGEAQRAGGALRMHHRCCQRAGGDDTGAGAQHVAAGCPVACHSSRSSCFAAGWSHRGPG